MKHCLPHILPARGPARSGASGFTLIEMLVVVSVLAIVMAAAAPGFRSFTAAQQVKAAAYDLTAALLLARSEALKRNSSVQIRRVGTSWNNGWTVTTVGTVTTLGSHNAVDSSLVFQDAPEAIVFNANGRVSSPASAVEIELSSTSADASSKRCIALALSGHARSSVGECP